MQILRTILTVIFAIDCIALNKGRSMEGGLVKATTIMAVLFFVLAAVLNMNF